MMPSNLSLFKKAVFLNCSLNLVSALTVKKAAEGIEMAAQDHGPLFQPRASANLEEPVQLTNHVAQVFENMNVSSINKIDRSRTDGKDYLLHIFPGQEKFERDTHNKATLCSLNRFVTQQCIDLDNSLQNKMADAEQCKEKLDEAEKKRKCADEKCIEAENDINSLRNEKKEQEIQKTENAQKIRQTENEIEVEKEEVEKYRVAVKMNNDKIDQIIGLKKELKTEIMDTDKQILENNEEKKTLDYERERVREQIRKLNLQLNSLDSEIEKKDTNIADLRVKNNLAKTKNGELKKEKIEKVTENQDYVAIIETHETAIDEKNTVLTALFNLMLTIETNIRDIEYRIRKAVNNHGVLSASKTRNDATLAGYQKRYDTINAKILDAEAKLEKSKDTLRVTKHVKKNNSDELKGEHAAKKGFMNGVRRVTNRVVKLFGGSGNTSNASTSEANTTNGTPEASSGSNSPSLPDIEKTEDKERESD